MRNIILSTQYTNNGSPRQSVTVLEIPVSSTVTDVDEETARAPTPDRSSSFATASILRTIVEILYPIYNPKFLLHASPIGLKTSLYSVDQ